MLRVWWKIGKKRRGNWNVPLEFHREYVGNEELILRPRLVIDREYSLPGPILLSNKFSAEKPGGGGICKELHRIIVRIDEFVDKAEKVHIRASLSTSICTYTCETCRAYLPWRPGSPPDYSDYEEVFKQVATDLCEAWNRAVAEAAASGELEKDIVVITSENIAQKEVIQAEKKTLRKIKV